MWDIQKYLDLQCRGRNVGLIVFSVHLCACVCVSKIFRRLKSRKSQARTHPTQSPLTPSLGAIPFEVRDEPDVIWHKKYFRL